MTEHWKTPNLGSIILLYRGFPNTDRNHFGLLLGVFKIGPNHEKYLLVSPGTSVVEGRDYSGPTTFVIKKKDSGLRSDTCFVLNVGLTLIDEYPSAEFVKSFSSPDNPKTTKVDDVPNLTSLLLTHENNTGFDLATFLNDSLNRYAINPNTLTPVKSGAPTLFKTK